jgi:hypothetical protein
MIKTPECCYKYAWIIACWNDNFTDYLCSSFRSEKSNLKQREIYIGNIFLSFLKAGHRIDVHRVNGGEYVVLDP